MGVSPGQPLVEAKVLLPKAVFLPDDLATDRQVLRQLALDSQQFSPWVGLEESSQPESLLCDVTGCPTLWGGEETYLNTVRDYWHNRAFHIQLALAGSVGAAWAVAHAVNSAVIPAGSEQAALSALPVELLRLPEAILERLNTLGLRTIRDLLKLPRESLASRFGAILSQRLDQALAIRAEMFIPERLNEPLTIAHEWDVPLEDREMVANLCRQMLAALLSMADIPGAGLQEVEGELQTEVDVVRLEICLVQPSRDEQHLAQLLNLRLERCRWSGGVIAIQWTVRRLGWMSQSQENWFDRDLDTNFAREIIGLVEKLGSRLGNTSIAWAETLPDAQPEHSMRLVPWTTEKPADALAPVMTENQSRDRPCQLLGIPEPIGVISKFPGGPPERVLWRSQKNDVVRAWGPERIETGWWRETDIQRDYYRTEWIDGTHAWIFRDDHSERWFLHGFFE